MTKRNVKDPRLRTQELLAAIQTSDVEQVKKLLESGISLDDKDKNGQTPLTLVSSLGNIEIISLLIAAGAKINPDPEPLVFNPRISGTELPGGQNLGELIAQATAKAPEDVKNFYGGLMSVLDTLSGKSEPPLDNLADEPTDIESAQEEDDDEEDEDEDEEIACTPLEAAVLKGDISTVKALLQAGAAPNPSVWYQTPVLVTAARKGYVEIVRELIAAGANVNRGLDELPCTRQQKKDIWKLCGCY